MPSHKASHGQSAEEAISVVRREHLLGVFKVMLPQTENHPDQRTLDQNWVDHLTQTIGSPESLNRALYPISVVLSDNKWAGQLKQLQEMHSSAVPTLPTEIKVQVFSGQHRLAMLSQLQLEEPDQLWWHAEVYKKELETNHPAEFLTMIHESNTPQVMKAASDLELFRAVHKLKGYLRSGAITEETFLQNRRLLLRADERTSRAISNLIRNDDLANAIERALTREHIARQFSAGSWMRLTTGRLYMVAAGLVGEMVAQVDLLTEGMVDIPTDVLMLQPRACLVTKIKTHTNAGKKRVHPWDQLPGKRAGALKRVVSRPPTFVSNLNPKTADPWSLPDIVLLPSCLGSKLVEDELKTMQTVTHHFLKMIQTEKQFQEYHRAQSQIVEHASDHPAGIIASFLLENHRSDENAAGYEQKIMHMLWKSRVELNQELHNKNVPGILESSEADYQMLIDESNVWWDVMRRLKVCKLRSWFNLRIPREFGGTDQPNTSGTPVERESSMHGTQEIQSSTTPQPRTSKRALEDTQQGVRRKRPRGTSVIQEDPDEEDSQQGGNCGIVNDDRDASPSLQQNPTHPDMDDLEGSQLDDESGEEMDNSSDPIQERRGGDRRLASALDRTMRAADSMTRGESRAVTELLEQIMESRGNGDMEKLVRALVSKGKKLLVRLERSREAEYESPEEETGERSQSPIAPEASGQDTTVPPGNGMDLLA